MKLGGRPPAKPRERTREKSKEAFLTRKPHKGRPLERRNYEYEAREVERMELFLGRVPGEQASI